MNNFKKIDVSVGKRAKLSFWNGPKNFAWPGKPLMWRKQDGWRGKNEERAAKEFYKMQRQVLQVFNSIPSSEVSVLLLLIGLPPIFKLLVS